MKWQRFFDLIFSVPLFILLLPLMLIVIMLLAIFQDGNIFFIQPRPGLNEKIFKIIKFKTMRDPKDDAIEDLARLTKIGQIIRSLSLDELPQLWNVIKGEMSLVGPRPLLVEYLPLYNDMQKRRHEVRPGLTGWAQVNGRNAVDWQKRFELDVWYIEHQSMSLYFKILCLTLIKVIRKQGITQQNVATMEKFLGNAD